MLALRMKQKKPKLRNLMYLMQVFFFTKITNIVSDIGLKIKLADDMEILYLRLIKLLNESTELNLLVTPFILKDVDDLIDELGSSALPSFKEIRNNIAEGLPF